MDVKTRKRLLKKVRGKEVFMTMAYSRGQPVLPPRLQHGVPSGRSPPVHCSQGGGNMAPYGPYHPQNPPQRHNRGFGMPRYEALKTYLRLPLVLCSCCGLVRRELVLFNR